MKASSFPKLDRPPRNPAARISADSAKQLVDEKTWKSWRMKLGASRKEANRLWTQYQEWVAQEAQNGPVRTLKVASWQDWEREFRAFLDEMPRKPYAFLAMVARLEMQRAQLSEVRLKKAVRRTKYIRRYERIGAQRRTPSQS